MRIARIKNPLLNEPDYESQVFETYGIIEWFDFHSYFKSEK